MNNPAPTPGGVTSQDFEPANDAFDSFAADDFVIPPGETWQITGVDVAGEYGTPPGPAESFHVFFYANAAGDLPGGLVATRFANPYTGGANAVITLTSPVILGPGTYWVSVQARQDADTVGQWFWDNRLVISNAGAAWQNPGGGFMVGCTTWDRKTTCLTGQNGPDQLFRLHGSICSTVSFTNSTTISLPDGTASPYPSDINVAGQGTVQKVTVTINGLSHTFPDDLDFLLVGPQGQNAIIWSDAGGGTDIVDATVTLDDNAAIPLPDSSPIVSGTYRPANYGTGDTWPAPAPAPSGNVALSTFNGTDPNGTWSLYVVDDAGGDVGMIAGGWTLSITSGCSPTPPPTPPPCPEDYVFTTDAAGIDPGTTDIGNHTDDGITFITLPFPYQLYDQTFTGVNISSNGNLQFVSNSTSLSNTCPLPTTTLSYPIMPHWDDLRTDQVGAGCAGYPGATCGVFISTTGTAPNRIFNIEWRAVYFANSSADQANFEVRLHEGQDRFDIVYGEVAQGGSSATVGVQKDTGSQFTQFECNTPDSLTNGLELIATSCLATPTPTGTPSATPTATATATPTTTVPPTPTATATATSTATPTATPTATVSCTPSYILPPAPVRLCREWTTLATTVTTASQSFHFRFR